MAALGDSPIATQPCLLVLVLLQTLVLIILKYLKTFFLYSRLY